MSAVAFSAMLTAGKSHPEDSMRHLRQDSVRQMRQGIAEHDEASHVLNEMRSFRLWAEKRLDDVCRDLRRVFEHQQKILLSQERFSRLHDSDLRVHPPADEQRLPTAEPLRWPSSLLSTSEAFEPGRDGLDSVPEEATGHAQPLATWRLDSPSQGKESGDTPPVAGALKSVQSEQAFQPREYASSKRVVRPSTHSSYAMPEVSASASTASASFARILHPHSYVCLLWDLLGVLMLAYDLFLLPVVLAWDLPSEGVVFYGSWTTVTFWTTDMVLSLMKGFEGEDKTVVRGWRALRHYLRTWFFLDLAVLVCDWTSILLEASQSDDGDSMVTDVIKLFRILKLNRFLRVMAVVKMGRLNVLLESMNRAFLSLSMLGNVRIVFRVARFLVPGMLINHWCACLWYAVGKHFPDYGNRSWLQNLETREAVFEYSMALQWAVSHMFGGSPVTMATSSSESIFTVVAMVLGAICGSILISLVATMMMDIQNATLNRRKQLQEVQRFVHENGVGNRLAAAILKQVRERTDTRGELLLKDVPILSALSHPLWRELSYHLFAPKILEHGFLRVCDQVDQSCIKDLCGSAIHEHIVASHDELFSCGDDALISYFVKAGDILYFFSEGSNTETQAEYMVEEGDWLAEVAIWLRWQYHGTAIASRPCELLSLSVQDFERVIKAYAEVATLVEAFGRSLAAYLKRVPANCVTDLPLQKPPTSVERDTVMLLMPPDLRFLMSRPVLTELSVSNLSWGSFLRRKKGASDLEAEVEKGGCLLKMDGAKRVVRLVSVAVLRLKDMQGRELVHMGDVNPEAPPVPMCEYPATKARAGESPEEALHRLITKDLPLLAELVEVGTSEVVIQESDSNSYGLPTKYLRTVFHATLGQRETEFLGKVVDARRQPACKKLPYSKSMASNATSHLMTTKATSHRTDRPGVSPQNTVKSTKSMPGRMVWSHNSLKGAQEEAFDQGHETAAYVLDHPSRAIYAWLLEDDFQSLKLRKTSLQPWLQELIIESQEESEEREDELPPCKKDADTRLDNDDVQERTIPPVLSVPVSKWRQAPLALCRQESI